MQVKGGGEERMVRWDAEIRTLGLPRGRRPLGYQYVWHQIPDDSRSIYFPAVFSLNGRLPRDSTGDAAVGHRQPTPLARPFPALEWLQLTPTLEHPLIGADQVPRRLAKDGAPAILHGAPEVFVAPCPAARRIVRRADHVR